MTGAGAEVSRLRLVNPSLGINQRPTARTTRTANNRPTRNDI